MGKMPGTAQLSPDLCFLGMCMYVFNLNSVCCSCQLLQCGGNLYDVVSLAVKAALHNTKYVYCLDS